VFCEDDGHQPFRWCIAYPRSGVILVPLNVYVEDDYHQPFRRCIAYPRRGLRHYSEGMRRNARVSTIPLVVAHHKTKCLPPNGGCGNKDLFHVLRNNLLQAWSIFGCRLPQPPFGGSFQPLPSSRGIANSLRSLPHPLAVLP
jgi:hypothetical protein